MQILLSNLGGIIFISLVIATFSYKAFAKYKDGITSKFKIKQLLETDTSIILTIINQALSNARFSKIGFDADENRFYAQSRI